MKERIRAYGRAGLAVLIPAAIFYLFEGYTHDPFADIRWDLQVFNLLFFELSALFLYCLFGRLHVALMTETIFFMLYGLANYFVLSFRSQPILPWDFFSIGTAAEVAGDFKYTLNTRAWMSLAGFFLLLAVELLFCRNRLKDLLGKYRGGPWKSWAIRLPAAAGALAMLLLFVNLLHDEVFVEQKLRMYDKLFTPTAMSEMDGTAVAFLLELQYIAVEKPEGYRREEAQELLEALEDPAEDIGSRPNIIVIMDEAFSDPAVLGEFETNTDYMPFLHGLQAGGENTVTGTLDVSVKGGNTANTEFEFLTGSSMAFLPEGSIPYQQYIDAKLPSLASHLASLGYVTEAAHPYLAAGWDRNQVYPLMGFSRSDFIESFAGAKKIRRYVSDAAAFDHIIERYEAKEENSPLFFFEVTMQNHSGYTEEFDNFTPDVRVEGNDSLALRQYLSLIRQSDAALSDLIGYFEEQTEPTIIVFFGDHQPADSVVEPIWRMQGKTGGDLTRDEEALRYQVPFLIWANYDIEESCGEELSANYLGARVLEIAGLPMPAYQKYLAGCSEAVPVLTSREMKTADGYAGDPDGYEDWIREAGKAAGEDIPAEAGDGVINMLETYRKLQYYLLFDRQ